VNTNNAQQLASTTTVGLIFMLVAFPLWCSAQTIKTEKGIGSTKERDANFDVGTQKKPQSLPTNNPNPSPHPKLELPVEPKLGKPTGTNQYPSPGAVPIPANPGLQFPNKPKLPTVPDFPTTKRHQDTHVPAPGSTSIPDDIGVHIPQKPKPPQIGSSNPSNSGPGPDSNKIPPGATQIPNDSGLQFPAKVESGKDVSNSPNLGTEFRPQAAKAGTGDAVPEVRAINQGLRVCNSTANPVVRYYVGYIHKNGVASVGWFDAPIGKCMQHSSINAESAIYIYGEAGSKHWQPGNAKDYRDFCIDSDGPARKVLGMCQPGTGGQRVVRFGKVSPDQVGLNSVNFID
jgi:Protein of unknown function (DUF1036)